MASNTLASFGATFGADFPAPGSLNGHYHYLGTYR